MSGQNPRSISFPTQHRTKSCMLKPRTTHHIVIVVSNSCRVCAASHDRGGHNAARAVIRAEARALAALRLDDRAGGGRGG
jgi:hypothetical protein